MTEHAVHDDSRHLADREHRYQRRMLRAVLLILLVISSGTIGYMVLEGWNLLDALYMTIITMTTVGYGETNPLDSSGRLFTIGLLIASIGIAGYAISIIATFVVEGEFARIIRERRMDHRIAHLEHHIILCGGGRIGKYIAHEFAQTQTPFVLIERDREVLQAALDLVPDTPYIQADATQDETLQLAGIARANGLVAALGDDKENVFLVLTARALNPRLRIVARAVDETSTSKLKKAGADEIVSPNLIGGLRMASVMLRPAVVSFLDEMLRVPNQTLRVDEVHVRSLPHAVGQTLGAIEVPRRTGMLVLAIKSPSGGYRFNPAPDTLLKEDDILILIGTPQQIAHLRELER